MLSGPVSALEGELGKNFDCYVMFPCKRSDKYDTEQFAIAPPLRRFQEVTDMLVTRREGFASAPITAGTARDRGAKRAKTGESSFDQITLSARRGQETSPAFRDLAADLSHQVRTYNTTGKIQELRRQVMAGEYRPDARETAARMLLMTEDE